LVFEGHLEEEADPVDIFHVVAVVACIEDRFAGLA
jgi:hypothetical protein